jgi:hypothetical protein
VNPSNRSPSGELNLTTDSSDNTNTKGQRVRWLPDPARPIGDPIVGRLCQTPVKKSIRHIRVICGSSNFSRNLAPDFL